MEVNRCSRVQCVVEQAASSVYMDSRSVTLRGTLTLGRYVVLPTTFLPGATGRFLLRLFSHSHIQLRCVTGVCVCVCMFDKKHFETRVFFLGSSNYFHKTYYVNKTLHPCFRLFSFISNTTAFPLCVAETVFP